MYVTLMNHNGMSILTLKTRNEHHWTSPSTVNLIVQVTFFNIVHYKCMNSGIQKTHAYMIS